MNYKKQSNHLLSVAIQTKANDDNSLRLSGKPSDSRNWQTEIKSIRKSSKIKKWLEVLLFLIFHSLENSKSVLTATSSLYSFFKKMSFQKTYPFIVY